MTLTTIAGPARKWTRFLQGVVDEGSRLNNTTAATVVLREGLRVTEAERVDTVNAARNAEAMSTAERVRRLNPERDNDWLAEETARVQAEFATVFPAEF